jgi:hypothetical protein
MKLTRTEVAELIKTTTTELHAQIDALTRPNRTGPVAFTKKTAGDLKAGISDGVRMGVHRALGAAGVTIED